MKLDWSVGGYIEGDVDPEVAQLFAGVRAFRLSERGVKKIGVIVPELPRTMIAEEILLARKELRQEINGL